MYVSIIKFGKLAQLLTYKYGVGLYSLQLYAFKWNKLNQIKIIMIKIILNLT